MTLSLNLNKVLDQTIKEAKTILEVAGTTVLLLDSTTNELVVGACAGLYPETLIGKRIPIKTDIVGWAVTESRPVSVETAQQAPRLYPHIDSRIDLKGRSMLSIPLIFKERVLGIIEVINKKDGKFSHYDLELLDTLANSTAIEVAHAQLFETEQKQRRRLEALQAAATVVSQTLDITEVLDHLLKELEKVIPLDSGSVFLVEDNCVRIAAARGLLDVTVVDQKFPWNELTHTIEQTKQPLILVDAQVDSRFQPLGDNDYVRSWMGVPLLVQGSFIGYFTLDSRQPGVYDQTDANLVLSFANQAAIAVEKAQLFADLNTQMRALRETQYELVQSEKMAAIGRLSASLAHEINNPIQAIQNSLSLIVEEVEDQRRPEELQFLADVAKTELSRISTLIQRMREFSQSPTRERTFSLDTVFTEDVYHLRVDELQMIDLHTTLESILQLTAKQLQNSKVKVEQVWADNLPLVQGDPDQLKQVFMNLILNANESMLERGGTVTIRTGPDRAKLFEDEPQPVVNIEVNDTGIGIRPEDLPHVFEPLFSSKEQGWGLGLFTSYKIIEAHHGQITATSKLNEGTTFTILLPLKQPDIWTRGK